MTLDGADQKLALTVAPQDKYHPRDTGVYDVSLAAYEGPQSKDEK